MVYLSTYIELIDRLLTKAHSLHQGSFFALHSFMSFDKCTLSYIHHYSVIHDSSIALKVPCAPHTHPAPSASFPQILATTHLFTISKVLPTIVLFLSFFQVSAIYTQLQDKLLSLPSNQIISSNSLCNLSFPEDLPESGRDLPTTSCSRGSYSPQYPFPPSSF